MPGAGCSAAPAARNRYSLTIEIKKKKCQKKVSQKKVSKKSHDKILYFCGGACGGANDIEVQTTFMTPCTHGWDIHIKCLIVGGGGTRIMIQDAREVPINDKRQTHNTRPYIQRKRQ